MLSLAPRLPYRILITLVATAVFGYAAYASAKRGLADWNSMRARHEIAGWAEHRATPPPERLQEAITTLIDALALAPNDPTLIEHLGTALELRASASAAGSEMRRLSLTAALIYFRRAAALRPSSPYTWANILLAKYRLAQLDNEFFDAMRNALDLGPWEPAVQLIVADVTLGAWDKLDNGLRAHANENLRRAALRQADGLARLATDRGRIDLVCAAAFDRMKSRLKCVRKVI
ncbi:MAG: hypothetical protein IH605_02040 [Burkholderiales bacterium]|nr:hypothetical protein [Burkholderiales bacterium]